MGKLARGEERRSEARRETPAVSEELGFGRNEINHLLWMNQVAVSFCVCASLRFGSCCVGTCARNLHLRLHLWPATGARVCERVATEAAESLAQGPTKPMNFELAFWHFARLFIVWWAQ